MELLGIKSLSSYGQSSGFIVCSSGFVLVALNSIRATWFQHPYAGITLGFAREHRLSDAYVRCLLCSCDLKVGSRGISTYLEHCRGVIHHRQDCLVRLRRGLLLRRPTGGVMRMAEAAQMGEELRGLSVQDLEVCPALSVQDVFRIESGGGSIWSSTVQDVPDTERSLRMFLSVVVDALYRGGDVTGLTKLWDSLSATDVSYGSLFGGGCRKEDVVVSICFMSYMFACYYMLLNFNWASLWLHEERNG